MPYSIVQAGTNLVAVATDGTFETLTLPTGVTLSATRRPRFAMLDRTVFLVNSPTQNLAIDPDLTVRIMTPAPPQSSGRTATGSGTGLTGSYLVWYTHRIKDADGNLLAESPLSPRSPAVTLTNQSLAATFAPVSHQSSVNARGVYRSTTGGTTPFHLFDLDDNTVTSWEDNLADAGLSLLAEVGSLGVPPGSVPGSRMELLVAWKNRLWGRSGDDEAVDRVVYSEDRKSWAWPATNELIIPPSGQDNEGVTAFVPRRDFLGVARRNSFYQIVPARDGFTVTRVKEGKGLVAPDSVVVINDIGYGLGYDGVYAWSGANFDAISDAKVRAWFTTDTYFNRAEFPNAIAGYNSLTNSYELHLAAAGQTTLNRWISYNISNGQWYGPHKTDAFTPSTRFATRDANNNDISLVGGTNGFLHKYSSTRTDDSATAIDMDCRFIFHANSPAVEKVWLQPDVLSEIEASGSATLTPTVGALDASASSAISIDLTKDRQRLTRIGRGRYLQVKLQQNSTGTDFVAYGLEFPYEEIGKR